MTIGEKIKEARINAGFSQKQLAEVLGTKQANIARYESNTQSPTVRKLLEIARATKITPSWFLKGVE